MSLDKLKIGIMVFLRKDISMRHVSAFLLILLIGLAFRCYWITQKEGMYGDEVWSMVLCTYNAPFRQVPVKGNLTGEEIVRQSMLDTPTVHEALRDLKSLHRDVRDYNHTNFYYSLLRTAFIGFDSANIKDICQRAFMLNLLIYVAEFCFFFMLLRLYCREHPLLLYGTLLCFALMVGGVSNTIYLRPYQLQEFTFVLLAFWATLLIRRTDEGKPLFTMRNFCITAVVLALALWTGYFVIAFVGFMGMGLLWQLYQRGLLKKGIMYFTGVLITALLLCRLLYQRYFDGYQGDDRVTNMVSGYGYRQRFIESACKWVELIYSNTVYVPVLIAIVAIIVCCVFYRKRRVQLPWFILPAAAFTLFIMFIAPAKVNRYIVAAEPLLLLAIPCAFSLLQKQRVQLVLMLAVCCKYLTVPCHEYRMEHLYRDSFLTESLKSKKNITAVLDSKVTGHLVDLIPYLDSDKKYNIITNDDSLNVKTGDMIFVSLDQPDDTKDYIKRHIPRYKIVKDKVGIPQRWVQLVVTE